MDLLNTTEEKEAFLFRLLAIVSDEERTRLTPTLVKLGTVSADRALAQIFRRMEESNSYHRLQPNLEIEDVWKWVFGNWRQFTKAGETNALQWLFDEKWSDAFGTNKAFSELAGNLCGEGDWERLPDLYSISYRYEMASDTVTDRFSAGREAIERVVLTNKFASVLKKGEMRTPKHQAQESIRVAEFEKRLKCKSYRSVGEVVIRHSEMCRDRR